MARPCKSIQTQSKNLTKEEKKARLESESALRGASDNIKAPSYLSFNQKKIFKYITSELDSSGILGNLDIYILSTCCIAIDRMQEIEVMINNDPSMLLDRTLLSAKEKYTKEFFRCCNELSLSPQSRAKLSNINIQANKENEDPLLKLLAGGKA